MSRHVNRPSFAFNAAFMAAKVMSLNGEAMVPGTPISREAIEAVGERRAKQLYEARMIDFASDVLPPQYEVAPEEGAVNDARLAKGRGVEVTPKQMAKRVHDIERQRETAEQGAAERAARETMLATDERAEREADARVLAAKLAAKAAAEEGGTPPAADTVPPAPGADDGSEEQALAVTSDCTLVNKKFGRWAIETPDGKQVGSLYKSKGDAEKLIEAARVRGA